MQKITIVLQCPNCQSTKIVKNGKKANSGKQNYLCKACRCQFIFDNDLTYKGCYSLINHRIERMLVRGVGKGDIAEIEKISLNKVLSVLAKSNKIISPKQAHYKQLAPK